MEKSKELILTAIVLMVLVTAHRSCRKSFNHDFITDRVAAPNRPPHYVHIPNQNGYYTIRPDTLKTGKGIWTVGTKGIAAARLEKVKANIEQDGFELHEMEGTGFSVFSDSLNWDVLVRSIREIEKEGNRNPAQNFKNGILG